VTRVDDNLVFTVDEINTAIRAAMEKDTFTITCSTDILSPPSHVKGTIAIPQIQLDQLRSIASIRQCISSIGTGEDMMNTAAAALEVHDLADVTTLELGGDEYKTMTIDVSLDDDLDYGELMDAVDNPVVATVAAAVQGKDLTSKASHFHRRELKKSPEWDEWKQAEWKQLDVMQVCNMFGPAVSRSKLSNAHCDCDYDIT